MNHSIQKDCKPVVDFIDIEDIPDKAPLCRCWKSKKFPYCDGFHNAHNIMTGDNTGPILVGNNMHISTTLAVLLSAV